MSQEQIEALIAYMDARMKYAIDSALGRETSYSWIAISDCAKETEDLLGMPEFTLPR